MENLQELFEMETDEMLKIAKKFRWNEEHMQNGWFSEMDKLKFSLGIEFDEKISKRSPHTKFSAAKYTKLEECIICCEDFTTKGNKPFALVCTHTFCTACWVNYLMEQLRKGVEGIDAPCM